MENATKYNCIVIVGTHVVIEVGQYIIHFFQLFNSIQGKKSESGIQFSFLGCDTIVSTLVCFPFFILKWIIKLKPKANFFFQICFLYSACAESGFCMAEQKSRIQ